MDLCNTQKHVGKRTFPNDEYLKFDKFHYKNRVLFAMYYDIECIIKNKKHIPIACDLYLKSDYPDILEDKYKNYFSEDIIDWFICRVNYYNKLFKNIF